MSFRIPMGPRKKKHGQHIEDTAALQLLYIGATPAGRHFPKEKGACRMPGMAPDLIGILGKCWRSLMKEFAYQHGNHHELDKPGDRVRCRIGPAKFDEGGIGEN
jgi:hypothetical protein